MADTSVMTASPSSVMTGLDGAAVTRVLPTQFELLSAIGPCGAVESVGGPVAGLVLRCMRELAERHAADTRAAECGRTTADCDADFGCRREEIAARIDDVVRRYLPQMPDAERRSITSLLRQIVVLGVSTFRTLRLLGGRDDTVLSMWNQLAQLVDCYANRRAALLTGAPWCCPVEECAANTSLPECAGVACGA
ncbi:hypothetical protein [Nocardia altamirensis]|uniref:hypothetical protein n=1 Tax=Nocardia altamirensis TaxID=472158 RepID=UPI00084010BE|nr:hypothetical protein [Nocardia altamirensis]